MTTRPQGPTPLGRPTPGPAAAPFARRVLAQAGLERRIMLRNGEQLVLALVLPALLLGGLVLAHVPDLGAGRRVDVATPGVLALALMSTAFTGQAIATGFDRRYGVLRLLATTPLGRTGLLAGKAVAVASVQTVQMAVLGALALLLGWRPDWSGLPAAVLVGVSGTAAFVSLGLLVAGAMRAEAVLAVANLLWVLLLAGGGVVVPASQLPGVLASIGPWLPSGALGDGMRAALLDGTLDVRSLAVLAAWTALAAAVSARTFRWD